MFGEELEPPLEAAMAAVEIRMNNEVIESVLDQDHRKIFNAARDGQAITLYALLKDQATPEQHHILNMPVQEGDGQNCPPLVIAARNGHDNVVQTLISKFNADIEINGKVKFGGYTIEGATPLWCAAGAGHFSVVQALVSAGADVNRTTRTNSTPLRAACFDGRTDIVKFLVEKGNADFNIANKFNNTCLMIAAFKGHVDVVRYLLEAGANPDVAANCGASAMHFAAETGALSILRELLEKGSANAMLKNDHGLTPLQAAAEHCQVVVFEYLFEKISSVLSKKDKIDALELIGGSYANDKEHYDVDKSFDYLLRAMDLRWSDPEAPILKEPVDPIPAYENHVESATIHELELRKQIPHRLHMEGLAIRERILGCSNPEVPHPIIFRGAVFADSTDFDRCVALWLHALRLKQNQPSSSSVVKDVLRFAQVFSQMIHLGVDIKFQDFLAVMEATANELSSTLQRLASPTEDKDDPETLTEYLETNTTTFLYLLCIFSKLGGEELDVFQAMKIVHKVVSDIKPKSKRSGKSLIHMAVDSVTPIDDFHTRDVVRFPCAKTTKLLIEAGADVQVMDNDGNTPLHLIVGYQRVVGDFLTLHSVITSLVDAGAHVDVVNANGKTPMAKASTGVAEIILKSQQRLSLKCLSARAVKRHGLSYIGQVPATLEHFISLHGP